MTVLGAGAGSEGMAMAMGTDMDMEDTVTAVVVDSLEEMEEVVEGMEEAVNPLFQSSINFWRKKKVKDWWQTKRSETPEGFDLGKTKCQPRKLIMFLNESLDNSKCIRGKESFAANANAK